MQPGPGEQEIHNGSRNLKRSLSVRSTSSFTKAVRSILLDASAFASGFNFLTKVSVSFQVPQFPALEKYGKIRNL